MDFVFKYEELCIKNEELCIKNEELCIKNDRFRRQQFDAGTVDDGRIEVPYLLIGNLCHKYSNDFNVL